ncbi:hypothetical protein AWENTII_007429 [Aspergillus wentii]
MPRPKVHPSNRLRAFEACLFCRTSKKRCTGSFPCPNCIHRGRADSCVPSKKTGPSHQSRPSFTSPSSNAADLQTSAATPASRAQVTAGFSPHNEAYPPIHSSSPQPNVSARTPIEPGPGSPEAQHRTHPRMLRSLQGERVFVGKAASLSFLQLLRDTITQHIGPSQFSHNVRSDDMLETETPHDVPSDFEDRLDRDQKLAFVRAYRIATSGFIDAVPDSEATEILNESSHASTDPNNTRTALKDVMVAIGAQSCKSYPIAIQTERFFFARGQRRAFASMLENPSLELVRLFLLMAFYMLGACRRNAAFMYLGVAARASVALGLHQTDSSGLLSMIEQNQRSQVWMSVCVLDFLVSSILGRPSATATLRSETGDISLDMTRQSNTRELSLVASYHMSLILEEIITQLYSEKAASAEVAEALLEKLKRWSDNLPAPLLTTPRSGHELFAAQERIIGSLHVACSYHFAVIIVTRPFLISALSIRLARLHQDLSETTLDRLPEEDPAHSRLATGCIDSAIYMIQTCLEIHRSHLLLGNMCILKAFVFAAALTLGFSMFSQMEVDSTWEEAFNGATEILRIFSQQSAQAAHYSDILTSLANAIAEQRQRLTSHRRQSRSRYVSKLFTLDGRRPPPPRTA